MLIILANKITPRITYAASQIFERILQIPYQITDRLNNNTNSNSFVVCYGAEIKDSVNVIYCSGLCNKAGIEIFTPQVSRHLDNPVYFLNKEKSNDYNIDIFSLVFYFLSRYEEYLPTARDKHDRFTSDSGLAGINSHLDFPIVDYWVRHFGEYLISEFPELKIPTPKFQFIPSFDIDHAWKYKNKGWIRNGGGFLKDLLAGSLDLCKERYQVLINKLPDPYYTFDEIHNAHKGMGLIYFFLLGEYNKKDINIPANNRNFVKLLRQLSGEYTTGIHPSYRSNYFPDCLKAEIDKLESIANIKITKSRQHFLKLNLPETYEHLISSGITNDYTMGYADNVGFRAGTAHSFTWYNLSTESSTGLTIWPFLGMDVAMRDYLKIKPEEAFLRLSRISDSLQETGGNMILIWHNSSFIEGEGWSKWVKAYKDFLNNIQSSLTKA